MYIYFRHFMLAAIMPIFSLSLNAMTASIPLSEENRRLIVDAAVENIIWNIIKTPQDEEVQYLEDAELLWMNQFNERFDANDFKLTPDTQCFFTDIVAQISNLSKKDLQRVFGALEFESPITLACRLIYGERYRKNLSNHLDCTGFLENYNALINFEKPSQDYAPSLFGPDNLVLVLGILEPFNQDKITKLNLYGAKLTSLPPVISILSHLLDLRLTKNYLKELPASLKDLPSLQTLDCADNRFSTIPSVIFSLTNLKELCVSGNKIRELTKDLGHLNQLKLLDISNNFIKEIPVSFFEQTRAQVFINKHELPIKASTEYLDRIKVKYQEQEKPLTAKQMLLILQTHNNENN